MQLGHFDRDIRVPDSLFNLMMSKLGVGVEMLDVGLGLGLWSRCEGQRALVLLSEKSWRTRYQVHPPTTRNRPSLKSHHAPVPLLLRPMLVQLYIVSHFHGESYLTLH